MSYISLFDIFLLWGKVMACAQLLLWCFLGESQLWSRPKLSNVCQALTAGVQGIKHNKHYVH